MNILYPAKFKALFEEYYECGYIQNAPVGFLVTFRDVPEAITQGMSFADSIDMASDALKVAMDFYTERGEEYPQPSAPLVGEVMIELKIV